MFNKGKKITALASSQTWKFKIKGTEWTIWGKWMIVELVLI